MASNSSAQSFSLASAGNCSKVSVILTSNAVNCSAILAQRVSVVANATRASSILARAVSIARVCCVCSWSNSRTCFSISAKPSRARFKISSLSTRNSNALVNCCSATSKGSMQFSNASCNCSWRTRKSRNWFSARAKLLVAAFKAFCKVLTCTLNWWVFSRCWSSVLRASRTFSRAFSRCWFKRCWLLTVCSNWSRVVSCSLRQAFRCSVLVSKRWCKSANSCSITCWRCFACWILVNNSWSFACNCA